MGSPKLNYTIEQVVKEKGIPRATLIKALEEAVLNASKKNSVLISI